MSAPSGSITQWIGQLKAGDAAAAQALWQGYYARLVGLARHKLRGVRLVVSGGEDVALSAFDSFCRRAAAGRFPQLADRDDLWRLLFVITERKAIDHVEYERRQKRGSGKVEHGSALDHVPGREPTPEQAAEVAEECRRLLDLLADDQLRAIAVAKMEGYTNKEIAVQQCCAEPTIERKLARIRKAWEKEVGQ
jgi:DNA-directed RNA polymerase specialized sigma24 family protein